MTTYLIKRTLDLGDEGTVLDGKTLEADPRYASWLRLGIIEKVTPKSRKRKKPSSNK